MTTFGTFGVLAAFLIELSLSKKDWLIIEIKLAFGYAASRTTLKMATGRARTAKFREITWYPRTVSPASFKNGGLHGGSCSAI